MASRSVGRFVSFFRLGFVSFFSFLRSSSVPRVSYESYRNAEHYFRQQHRQYRNPNRMCSGAPKYRERFSLGHFIYSNVIERHVAETFWKSRSTITCTTKPGHLKRSSLARFTEKRKTLTKWTSIKKKKYFTYVVFIEMTFSCQCTGKLLLFNKKKHR